MKSLRHVLALALVLAAQPASAEPPRGSITIERIADIKYPTNPAWYTGRMPIDMMRHEHPKDPSLQTGARSSDEPTHAPRASEEN